MAKGQALNRGADLWEYTEGCELTGNKRRVAQ